MNEVVAGRFISLEGGEGAGKSSALAVCQSHLEAHGVEVVLTREPGGTPLAEQVRALMLDPNAPPIFAETELLLVFAARAQHVREVIRPALARGAWVLSDRFTDSSYAYQGGGRGLSETMIRVLEDFAVGSTRPELTLLLDLPVAEGMGRARQRGENDRIETEARDFFEDVRTVFRERAVADPQRFRVVDAGLPLEQVGVALRHALDEFLTRVRRAAA